MTAVNDREFDESAFEETRAYARLPQMDIEIVHRKARDGEGEFVAVNVELLPFSQRLDRLFEMSDPFRLWGQMASLAWWPWLQGMQGLSTRHEARELPRKEE